MCLSASFSVRLHSCDHLEDLGIHLEHLGLHLEHLGIHLEHFGIHLEHLGIHLAHLGIHLAHFGIHLEHLGIHFGHFGGPTWFGTVRKSPTAASAPRCATNTKQNFDIIALFKCVC